MKKLIISLLIPFLCVAICSLLILSPLDNQVADYFQRPLKPLAESEDVIMVNVDDDAVADIGTWPFSRTVYSDMLISLKELGAQSVVFDLSFLDRSQARVDENYVNESLPAYVDDYFSMLKDVASESFESLADGSAAYDEAMDYYDAESKKYELQLNTAISHVVVPIDAVLAGSINDFGNTFLTLTFENGIEPSEQEKEYLNNYIALDKVSAENDTITKEYTGVQPALYDFMIQAKSAGFVNADPDKDGYLRHVHPVVKYNGKYYAQLVFRPILEMLGNPTVEITNNYIKAGNITIPRSEDGSVIIKYPKKHYIDYNDISLANIYNLARKEKDLVTNLSIMSESGFFDDLEDDENPYELYLTGEYIREELSNEESLEEGISYDDYLATRQQYFEATRNFLTKETEDYFCTVWEDDADYIHELFTETNKAFDGFMKLYDFCKEKVQDAMCIVGTNASSTTDYGLNQYEEHYPNPGVHYALANMILSQDFVDDSPAFISVIIALVVCLCYGFIASKIKRTGPQIIFGIAAVVVTAGCHLLYFIITKQYIGAVVPVVSVFVSFVATTILGFITANHDKKFITNAFSQCLSKEVVNEIVANPASFKLGGQRLEMTAMFTDIQKFSGFSELLTAGQLVALLNYYLTKMSDIIMDERGTVDKYEGDAIIALVGAPVHMDDHAQRACAAAIKMKAAEAKMNEEIVRIAAAPKPEEMDDEHDRPYGLEHLQEQ